MYIGRQVAEMVRYLLCVEGKKAPVKKKGNEACADVFVYAFNSVLDNLSFPCPLPPRCTLRNV